MAGLDTATAVAIALGMMCLMLGVKVFEYKGIADHAGGECADSGAQAYDLHALAAASPYEVREEIDQIFTTHTAGIKQPGAPPNMVGTLSAQMDANPKVKVRIACCSNLGFRLRNLNYKSPPFFFFLETRTCIMVFF